MQGYDFEIVYKKGKHDTVADALSRKEEESTLCSISLVVPSWMEEVRKEWQEDPSMR